MYCSHKCIFKQKHLILRFPHLLSSPTHTALIQALLAYSDPHSSWLFCLKESDSSPPSCQGKLTLTPCGLCFCSPSPVLQVFLSTFDGGKAPTPPQGMWHPKHSYQQPGTGKGSSETSSTRPPLIFFFFLLSPLVFGGPGGTNIASSRATSKAAMIPVQADQCSRALCFWRK